MFFLLLGKTSLNGNENLSTSILNFEMKYSSSISSIWSSILSVCYLKQSMEASFASKTAKAMFFLNSDS